MSKGFDGLTGAQLQALPVELRERWRLWLAETSRWRRLAVVKATAATAHASRILQVALAVGVTVSV
jgi:hypothetical protein